MEVVGTSAENALAEAQKTVRGLKWAQVAELEMELDGKKIGQYRAATKIYFDIAYLASKVMEAVVYCVH